MLALRISERDADLLPVDLYVELSDELRRQSGTGRRRKGF
jgi:hypothetical protein